MFFFHITSPNMEKWGRAHVIPETKLHHMWTVVRILHSLAQRYQGFLAQVCLYLRATELGIWRVHNGTEPRGSVTFVLLHVHACGTSLDRRKRSKSSSMSTLEGDPELLLWDTTNVTRDLAKPFANLAKVHFHFFFVQCPLRASVEAPTLTHHPSLHPSPKNKKQTNKKFR